jgi:hypothetical protein
MAMSLLHRHTTALKPHQLNGLVDSADNCGPVHLHPLRLLPSSRRSLMKVVYGSLAKDAVDRRWRDARSVVHDLLSARDGAEADAKARGEADRNSTATEPARLQGARVDDDP